jgi:hypothetical protein
MEQPNKKKIMYFEFRKLVYLILPRVIFKADLLASTLQWVSKGQRVHMLSEFKRVKKESAGSRKDVQYTNMQQYKQYLKQDMIQRSNQNSLLYS